MLILAIVAFVAVIVTWDIAESKAWNQEAQIQLNRRRMNVDNRVG